MKPEDHLGGKQAAVFQSVTKKQAPLSENVSSDWMGSKIIS